MYQTKKCLSQRAGENGVNIIKTTIFLLRCHFGKFFGIFFELGGRMRR
jgi:hypothetical protein